METVNIVELNAFKSQSTIFDFLWLLTHTPQNIKLFKSFKLIPYYCI